MLPPLQTIATLRPAKRSGEPSTAARAAAPAGSTRLRVFSIISRVADFSASSETSTKSSRRSRKIACGSSNAVLVASPSANVLVVSSTRVPACQERKAAGAASDCQAEEHGGYGVGRGRLDEPAHAPARIVTVPRAEDERGGPGN